MALPNEQVDDGMKPAIGWVDSSVIGEIDDLEAFSKTFSNDSDLPLQLKRLRRHTGDEPELWLGADAVHLYVQNISTRNDLEVSARYPDQCQIFCIQQKHSYARLYIRRELFDHLLSIYRVFQRIWDFVLPFSFKTKESDIGHAPFRFRQLGSAISVDGKLQSFECAYGFRYVELNHRTAGKQENPDYDPWSVRQSAIYQQYNSKYDRITFILICPSPTMRKELEEAIQRAGAKRKKLNAFDLHRIILSSLHENWRLYIRSLEALMMQQSEMVTLAQVQSEAEKLSPLTDFEVNFVDRQRLKMIEDKVLDLVIIFESLRNTVSRLTRQCQSHCLGKACTDCSCVTIIEELEEQVHEVQVNLKKADILHKRAQGTAQLLSDLLDYENAQIAHSNEKALNGLVKETKDENSKMRVLTERSTADAAAVKILTVITLIYLPVTAVANFFSSQLVRVDEFGQLSVVAGSWWFAAISIPLTIFTFIAWTLWLHYSIKSQKWKQGFTEDEKGIEDTDQRLSRGFGKALAGSRVAKGILNRRSRTKAHRLTQGSDQA